MGNTLKEQISSFVDVMTDRLKSPFGGTLILIWSILNWELLFMLMNFDPDTTLFGKIYLIKLYIKQSGWRGMLFLPVVWSGVSFTAFYFIDTVFLMWSHYVKKSRPRLLNWVGWAKFYSAEEYQLVLNSNLRKDEEIDNMKEKLVKSRGLNIVTTDNGINGNDKLEIIKATYGSYNNSFPATKELNNRIFNNRLDVVGDNSIVGDPDPGKPKKWHITYRTGGNVMSREYSEGANIIIDGNF